MREVYLANGRGVALVDEEEYELVSRYSWHLARGGYARTTICLPGGVRVRVHMHVLIKGRREGLEVDHINRNGLDNRRTNLRWVTHSAQMLNRRNSGGSSQYRGVSWHQRKQKWIASIGNEGKLVHIGYFDDEVEAALAFDKMAVRLRGSEAQLNFPR